MIGEALALTTPDRRNRAVFVIVTKRNAVVMAEIKLRQITVKMFFCTMLISPAHTALEH